MTRPFPATALIVAFCALVSTTAFAEPAVPKNIAYPLSSFSEVLERPLFAPDRKRHLKVAPPAAPETATLTAIILIKEKRYAMLREGNAAPRRIHEGEAIGAMTVKKVLRDRIVATATDGTESVIQLFADAPTDAAKTTSTAIASTSQPSSMTAPTATGMTPVDNRPMKPQISSNR